MATLSVYKFVCIHCVFFNILLLLFHNVVKAIKNINTYKQ